MSISRRSFLAKTAATLAAGVALKDLGGEVAAHADSVKAEGPFQPTWDSLSSGYKCPDWFRDAKFGIWAHWTAQCVPEQGDWYARQMYIEGNNDYKYQCAHYGHPSKVGFKDIDRIWRAENWDPDHLISLYKAAGAKYMVALANHHDNFDTYDSKFQEWNSVKLGPKKDIIGGWQRAVRKAGMKFGVSVHASHAWSFFEVAQGSDKDGPLAGVPYDGKLTKADGVGTWWEGLDPQELYAQNHTPGTSLQWEWDASRGSSVPDQPYIDKFQNRIMDLVDQHHPDLVCFDDTIMPLWPISDVGLHLTAHIYNSNMRRNHGNLSAVVNTKGLRTDQQKQSVVWDIERGASHILQPLPWQTESCIGQWHYARWVYDTHSYKTPDYVIRTLIDIVSKNGNLLLSIPVKGDGTIDSDELAFLQALALWMPICGEGIFGTRPWAIYGEGPLADADAARRGPEGFSEGQRKAYSPADIRFTTKKGDLYAFFLGWPDDGKITVKSLATGSNLGVREISKVELLGAGDVKWTRDDNGLNVDLPQQKPCNNSWALKITGAIG